MNDKSSVFVWSARGAARFFFVGFMLYALTDIVSLYMSVCRAIAWLTEGGYDNNCLQCQSNIQPNMPKGGGEKSICTLILWC